MILEVTPFRKTVYKAIEEYLKNKEIKDLDKTIQRIKQITYVPFLATAYLIYEYYKIEWDVNKYKNMMKLYGYTEVR